MPPAGPDPVTRPAAVPDHARVRSRPTTAPRARLRATAGRAVRRHGLRLAGSTVVVAAGAVPLTLVWSGYSLGLAHGLLVGAWACLVALVLMSTSGSTGLLAGAWGEENTRDELRRLRRQGVVHDWIDGLTGASGDVDHLVLTAGGAVAIDSRWRGGGSRTMDQWRADARDVTEAARRASLVLRAERHPLPVTPVLVVWGGAGSQLERGWVIDGVRILPGRLLKSWLREHGARGRVERDQAREVVRCLRRFRQRLPLDHVG